jgi:hypothetical protein
MVQVKGGLWSLECVDQEYAIGLLNDIFRVYTLIFVAWWAQMKEFQVHDYFGYLAWLFLVICTWTTLFNALILSWDLINHDYMKEITQDDV